MRPEGHGKCVATFEVAARLMCSQWLLLATTVYIICWPLDGARVAGVGQGCRGEKNTVQVSNAFCCIRLVRLEHFGPKGQTLGGSLRRPPKLRAAHPKHVAHGREEEPVPRCEETAYPQPGGQRDPQARLCDLRCQGENGLPDSAC